MTCPEPLRKRRLWSVTVGRLSLCLAGAAAVPWRPSKAGAGDASPSGIPLIVKFGGR